MMYYKLKSIKEGFELVGTTKRIGKSTDGFLYLTQDEIDKLNPDSIKGYVKPKKPIDVKYELYQNLNKP